MPDTGGEVVKLGTGSSWEGHSGRYFPVSVMKMRSLVGLSAHSASHWWSVHCVARMLLSHKLISCCARALMGVSIWDAVHLHLMDKWVLSGAGVRAPWHGMLEAVWPHCDEAQQVVCLRGLKGCPLVQEAGIQIRFARRSWWRCWYSVMSTAASDRTQYSAAECTRARVAVCKVVAPAPQPEPASQTYWCVEIWHSIQMKIKKIAHEMLNSVIRNIKLRVANDSGKRAWIEYI